MNQPYRVAIIDSMTGMTALAKAWNELLSESRSNTIFLTWEWLYAWTECFLQADRILYILTVYDENTLIGIAPWCVRKVRYTGVPMRRIKFLGTPESGSDYLDIFTKRGREKEVARAIYRFLFGEASSHWDCFGFSDMPSDSLFLLHFVESVRADGRHIEVEAGAFCPSLALPKTREDFLARLSSSRRKRFARDLRILERERKVLYHSAKLESVHALKEYKELYQQRWSDSDPLFLFLEKVYLHVGGEGKIQLDTLTVDGKNITALLHLRQGNSLFLYLMAVDRSFSKEISVGNVLVGLSIEKAIAEGFTEYNFLRGMRNTSFTGLKRRSLALSLFLQEAMGPDALADFAVF